MKQLLLGILLTAFIGFSVNAQYNLNSYPEKAFYKEKQEFKPKKFGGYLVIRGGFSPSHPDVFLGATAGITQRFGELSVSALPALNQRNLIVYNSLLGYRFPINNRFTITPKAGAWTYSEEGDGKLWKRPGNHLCYALECNMRIEGNLEFSVEGVDYRGQKYNAMKILTAGVRYIF